MTDMNDMALKYLKSHSLVQEDLLNHKLFYDLKLAAAQRHYHLRILREPVDFEGHDILIDDGHVTGKYQVKSALLSKTASWRVQCHMLYPTTREAADLNLTNPLLASNVYRGIILIDVSALEPVTCSYHFTDFFVISAIAHRLINKPAHVVRSAENVLGDLLRRRHLSPGDRILIRKGLFISPSSPMNLLTLCGFDSDAISPRRHVLELLLDGKMMRSTERAIPDFQETLQALRHEIGLLVSDKPKRLK
jgi:hypothetical protein